MSVFNHVGHCVTDLDRSRRFYEELLGFRYARELRPPDEMTARLLGLVPPVDMTAVYLERDGFTLELLHFGTGAADRRAPRVMNEPGLTHISLSVDDVDAVCAKVPDYGGSVLHETSLGGLAIMVRDPDGQLIELLPMSYRESL